MYEKLLDKYHRKGIQIVRNKDMEIIDSVCEALGKEVRRVRKEEGLSQEEMAEKAGISQQLISRIEKGRKNMSLITLKKLSKAIGRRAEISFV